MWAMIPMLRVFSRLYLRGMEVLSSSAASRVGACGWTSIGQKNGPSWAQVRFTRSSARRCWLCLVALHVRIPWRHGATFAPRRRMRIASVRRPAWHLADALGNRAGPRAHYLLRCPSPTPCSSAAPATATAPRSPHWWPRHQATLVRCCRPMVGVDHAADAVQDAILTALLS